MMQNKNVSTKKILGGLFVLTLGCLISMDIRAEESFDEMLKRVEADILKTEQNQQKLEKTVAELNQKYAKEFEYMRKNGGTNPYDTRLDAVKKQKQEQADTEVKATEKNVDKIDSKTSTPAQETIKTEKQKPAISIEPKKQERTLEYPLERKPQYRSRRPFIRGALEPIEKKVTIARRSGRDSLSFAKEESETVGYTGTTEENVFVFSDNLAAYCSIDTQSIDKMGECLKRILVERSTGSQGLKNQVDTMMREAIQDTSANMIAEAARYKNDSSGYEKNVLVPLQEKSSKATDERADIEVLTLTDMEALKLKNKLVQIYANQLAMDSLKDFSNYELDDSQITSINEEQEENKE